MYNKFFRRSYIYRHQFDFEIIIILEMMMYQTFQAVKCGDDRPKL